MSLQSEALQTIPARQGKAVRIAKDQQIRVINTHGAQVLDTWAVSAADTREYMSMEHTRSINSRWAIQTGLVFVSTRRRPMLTVIADTTPGAHDTLLCACSIEIYRELGVTGYHDNCEDNLHAALRDAGLTLPVTPAPLNLFMNIPIDADGSIRREPPSSRPGDAITFRAEMDLWMIFSACPQDITIINGAERKPTDAHFSRSAIPA